MGAIVDKLEDLMDRYGFPHTWDSYVCFINKWRLVAEAIEVRVLLDVATRCPDEKLRNQAIEKFGPHFDQERLDLEWPGRNCFEYDWAGAVRVRNEKEKACPPTS